MSSSLLAIIIIPIVVAIALAAWITAVYRADKHPQGGNTGGRPRKRKVTGGSFEGGGGRAVMPRRDATPPGADDYGDPHARADAAQAGEAGGSGPGSAGQDGADSQA